MPHQTELTDFDRPLVTDGGRTYDADAETVGDDWDGAHIYTSWGYGQTQVNVAKIVDVSETGKTVVAQMAALERVDTARTSESVAPTGDTYGDTFRLHVRGWDDDKPSFRGSYPYIDGDESKGTRRDSFGPWGDRESMTQTAPNCGH